MGICGASHIASIGITIGHPPSYDLRGGNPEQPLHHSRRRGYDYHPHPCEAAGEGRLACIDCPERRQPFGKRAKQFTSLLAFGKQVRVHVIDWDRYGRAVGWVYVNDDDGQEICVNRELVRAGLAWVYRRYCRPPELLKLEEEAREAGRGLWREPHPVPPWEFR